MRWRLALVVLAACASDDTQSDPQALSQVDTCELGQELYAAALKSLQAHAKPCASDAECVLKATDVDCEGFSVSLCGTIVQRDAVWDPEPICTQLESYPPSEFSCAVNARCAELVPVCDQGTCVGKLATSP